MKNNLYRKPCLVKTIRHALAIFLAFSMLFGLGACAEQKTAESEPVLPEQELETQALQTPTEAVETEPVIVERELGPQPLQTANEACLLYTSDAADE